ncbi:MAG TPA: class I SAM-dependent rRNA methyltransferase [Kofleriaceae bacterium]|nr:class I SAM-dependent rRNA methyltransferase [Kofleriaceae bacterium]
MPPPRSRRPPAGPQIRRGTVRLQHEVARRIRLGHPWIYREALDPRRATREEPGAAIELVDWDGEFVGRGVWDGESAISIRVMTRDAREEIGPALVRARVRSALAMRKRHMDLSREQAVRLVHGESDGLPAIFVDRYGDYLVCQVYANAVVKMLPSLYDALEAELSPAAIYEQRRTRPLAGEAPPRAAAELVRGSAAPVEVEVAEGDLRFAVDVTAPLSTGLFADLRLGRRAIARWARGRRVLNLFSYTGAISVYASHGGATEVAAVDVAAKAHARARRNFALSGMDPEKPDYIVGDVFKVLARMAERKRRFDLVVIDPPAFASGNRGGKAWSAVQDYGELVSASLDVLEPGGLLAAASSTHKVSLSEFDLAMADGAARSGTQLRIVERCGLPPDFPVAPGFPEGNYLKFSIAARD